MTETIKELPIPCLLIFPDFLSFKTQHLSLNIRRNAPRVLAIPRLFPTHHSSQCRRHDTTHHCPQGKAIPSPEAERQRKGV